MARHIKNKIIPSALASMAVLTVGTAYAVGNIMSDYGQIQGVQTYSSNPFWTQNSPYNQRMPVPIYVQGPTLTPSDCQKTVSALIQAYCSQHNHCTNLQLSDIKPSIVTQLSKMPNGNYIASCASYIDSAFQSYRNTHASAQPTAFPQTSGVQSVAPNVVPTSTLTPKTPDWKSEYNARVQELHDLQSENDESESLQHADFPKTWDDVSFSERKEIMTQGYSAYRDAKPFRNIKLNEDSFKQKIPETPICNIGADEAIDCPPQFKHADKCARRCVTVNNKADWQPYITECKSGHPGIPATGESGYKQCQECDPHATPQPVSSNDCKAISPYAKTCKKYCINGTNWKTYITECKTDYHLTNPVTGIAGAFEHCELTQQQNNDPENEPEVEYEDDNNNNGTSASSASIVATTYKNPNTDENPTTNVQGPTALSGSCTNAGEIREVSCDTPLANGVTLEHAEKCAQVCVIPPNKTLDFSLLPTSPTNNNLLTKHSYSDTQDPYKRMLHIACTDCYWTKTYIKKCESPFESVHVMTQELAFIQNIGKKCIMRDKTIDIFEKRVTAKAEDAIRIVRDVYAPYHGLDFTDSCKATDNQTIRCTNKNTQQPFMFKWENINKGIAYNSKYYKFDPICNILSDTSSTNRAKGDCCPNPIPKNKIQILEDYNLTNAKINDNKYCYKESTSAVANPDNSPTGRP